jgi:hypothetical protein
MDNHARPAEKPAEGSSGAGRLESSSAPATPKPPARNWKNPIRLTISVTVKCPVCKHQILHTRYKPGATLIVPIHSRFGSDSQCKGSRRRSEADHG